jgi:methylated-DNA-[protein]-cysteine S-methyltransferase
MPERSTPVATATLPGPLGPFALAATERGIVTAGWASEPDLVTALSDRIGPLAPTTPEALERLRTSIPVVEALLAGETIDARGVTVDLQDRPAGDRSVLTAVREVGPGRTASYGEVARRIGAPRAARAVGGAIGRNPIAMIIPCHRIIAADGTLGGYGGTGWVDRDRELSRKEALLLREGVTVARRGR